MEIGRLALKTLGILIACVALSSCDTKSEDDKELCFEINGQVLPTNVDLLICGFDMDGNYFTPKSLKCSPKLKNLSKKSFKVAVLFGYPKDVQFRLSSEYVLDTCIAEGDFNKYYVHLDHDIVSEEEISLPVKGSECGTGNFFEVFKYMYRLSEDETLKEFNLCLVGFRKDIQLDNTSSNAFLLTSRAMMDLEHPENCALAFNDTVLPSVRNVRPLLEDDIKISGLGELIGLQ